MITIITGDINEGKTSTMKKLYSKSFKGDGFLSIKVMDNGRHIGYDLYQLSNERKIPFIREQRNKTDQANVLFTIGKYYFIKSGFYQATAVIEELIRNRIVPIYIDELGPLELNRQGFYPIINKIISSNIPLITCVRNNSLEEIISLFDFREYDIIPVDKGVDYV